MPLTKNQKQDIVSKLADNLEKQQSTVFVALEGIKAKELFELRKQLKASDCKISIVKKTLLERALSEKKIEFNMDELKGQIAMVFGFKDAVAPARITQQFTLTSKNLKILGGLLENEFKGKEEMVLLASIPSREVLLAKLVGSLASPLRGLASVLQENITGFIRVLGVIKK